VLQKCIFKRGLKTLKTSSLEKEWRIDNGLVHFCNHLLEAIDVDGQLDHISTRACLWITLTVVIAVVYKFHDNLGLKSHGWNIHTSSDKLADIAQRMCCV
uniref:Uncharacterized protein n=1 Tax=Clytia hemisphaerica TaxID=252671 RepID=A0A7M5XMK0_9CNID